MVIIFKIAILILLIGLAGIIYQLMMYVKNKERDYKYAAILAAFLICLHLIVGYYGSML